MTARRARYARIGQITTALLRDRGIVGPAVPVAEIVAGYGIEVRAGELGTVSGLIARDARSTGGAVAAPVVSVSG